jgi:hypothetical protein
MQAKVGGEVDAFCTKCKMTLAHTILAIAESRIARVQCNTCGGQHTYRTGGVTRAPASPRVPMPRKEILSFQQRLEGRDLSAARKYSPKETFAWDDLVDHPTFGLGIVQAVRLDKVDIGFKASEKTLVHGRGEASGAKPHFAPPPPREAGPADKPQPPEPAKNPSPES